VQFGARMVVARDATPDIAQLGGVAFCLDRQVADNVDALAGGGVLEGNASWPDNVDLADGRAVQLSNRAAGPAKEDVSERGLLTLAGAVVYVEHDLPWGTRLHAVKVANGHHHPEAGKIDAIGVTVVDVPGQGAEALPETGGPARAATNAAARADRLAIAGLEIGASHAPVSRRPRP
jgi:hypothetical protein